MRVSNNKTLANVRQNENVGFSSIINSKDTRAMINRSVGDPARAASFVSTLISVVNTTPKLQQCDPSTVIAAALKGEVGMGLSVALGEYSIVPYGDKGVFQIGANGIKQLAIRSGKYSSIGFYDVREGEYLGRDPMTREPRFEWNEDEDERETLPIVGYYGFYKLNDENNNFFQCIYWSHEKILRHADKYAPSFDISKYNALVKGELSNEEVRKLQSGSPWYGLPDSEPHKKMCIKTIVKQLLGDGLAPKSVRDAILADNTVERTDEPVIPMEAVKINKARKAAASKKVDTDTGEIIDVDEIKEAEPVKEELPFEYSNDEEFAEQMNFFE